MKNKITVHIADDHKILVEGIIAVINTDDNIEVEGYSLTGKQVIDWIESNSADILILDINMPDYDGIEVLKLIRQKKITQSVIILSSYDDVKLVQELINLGANGFLSKESAGFHIIEAINAVHKGDQYFSDAIKNNLIKIFKQKTNPGTLVLKKKISKELLTLSK